MISFVRRYVRFALFFVTAIVATGIAAIWLPPAPAALAGFDIGAVVFFIAILWTFRNDDAEDMRRRSADNEPDQHILLAIGLVIVAVVIGAVAYELFSSNGHAVALSVGTLVLAWTFANLLFALHYAHSWYLGNTKGKDVGGIDFPGDKPPVYWDFVYFAFVLGMTFQVSDTDITTTRLRRIALAHSLIAFWFNIGVLALSVSVVSNQLK